MDQQQVDELAWDVVEVCRGHLTVTELNVVFIKLVVGEYESAIETVLKRLAREGIGLPVDLTVRLETWADIHQGGPAHAALTPCSTGDLCSRKAPAHNVFRG